MKQTWLWLAVAVVAAAILIGTCRSRWGSLSPDGADPVPITQTYELGGRSVELTIHHDHMGLVLNEGASQDELLRLLSDVSPGGDHDEPDDVGEDGDGVDEGSPGDGLDDQLHRFDPVGTQNADQVADLARVVTADSAVDHAGIAVTPAGSEHPLLMTHELIVQLVAGISDADLAQLLDQHGIRKVRPSRYVPGLWLLETLPATEDHVLDICADLSDEPLVDYAEPNFVHHVVYHGAPAPCAQSSLDDPLVQAQWHHDNLGDGGGSFDADIDSTKAWGISLGDGKVVIALVEDGFDAEHPDLVENLWSSTDDPSVHGWNFEDDDSVLTGWSGDPGATTHGTAVAGCAGARGNNEQGGSGSCPRCRLMLIRRADPTSYFQDAEAISWAWNNGADVISNSWGYEEDHPIPETVKRAIADAAENGRDGKGTLVLFGVPNQGINIDIEEDVSALPGAVAIAAVANTDERTRLCAYGPSIDLLGPSRLSQWPGFTQGTLNVVTTDWRGPSNGYNHDHQFDVEGQNACDELGGDGNYTRCFGGTSAAAPIVAGVAGLVLSVAPELTRVQLENLLQDTADRVQDSSAIYSPKNGRSTKHLHGHGRVNAFEAVRVAAPHDGSELGGLEGRGGLGGVDVFVRDHRLDWGNTEQPSWFLFEKERGVIGPWQSPDVVVDAPSFDAAPTSSQAFGALTSEAPVAGETNRVYVRVRNRGWRTARDVDVTLFWTEAAGAYPGIADPVWRALGVRTITGVANSGATRAGTAEDPAEIVRFDFDAPQRVGDDPVDGFAFLVVVSCHMDPLVVDPDVGACELVSTSNNAALHCVLPGSNDGHVVLVRNPHDEAIQALLEGVGVAGAPLAITPVDPLPGYVEGQEFALDPGAAIRVRVATGIGAELRQWQMDGPRTLLGGVTLEGPAAPE